MLTQKDTEAINACITRPNSVWEGIKSIITAEKYTWYIESLLAKGTKPDIQRIKTEWIEMDDDARKEYMNSSSTVIQAEQIGFKQFWLNMGILPFQKGKNYLHQMSGAEESGAMFVTYNSLKSLKEQFYKSKNEVESKSEGVPFTIDLWSLSADKKELKSKCDALLEIPFEGLILSYNGEYIKLKPEEQFIQHSETEESSLEYYENGFLFKESSKYIFFEQSNSEKRTKTMVLNEIGFGNDTVSLSVKKGDHPQVFRNVAHRAVVEKTNMVNHIQLHFSACFYDGGYDSDLVTVLQQVAKVLGGIDSDEFKIGSLIANWIKPKTKTMLRQTAFKTAVAFRFTIDETRDLLYKVLKDKEQFDFNPRLVDEMIYVYAIIQNLPLVTAQEMIDNSKKEYLTNVFGTEYQNYYEQLIAISDTKYNILDAQNTTKSAFLLAALIEAKNGTINIEGINKITSLFAESEDNFDSDEETDEETGRIPTLYPDVSVALQCYDYAYGIIQKESPQYRNSQTSIADLQSMIKLAQDFLSAAKELAELESKKKLYESMNCFLAELEHYTNVLPSNALFSPVDYLPLLAKTDLGRFSTYDFNTMIKEVFVKHFHLESQGRTGEGQRVGEYHPYILPRAISERTDYYAFFFFTLMTAVRDLRAVTLNGCIQIWPVYIRMNDILLHVFFDAENIGYRAWDYEQNIKNEDGLHTFTIYQIDDLLKLARETKKKEEFTSVLMRNFHIYENFHGFISRGKEEFIGSIEDDGKVFMHNKRHETGVDPLFLITDAGLPAPVADSPFKNEFYSSARFKRQYIDKSEPYTRNDMIKLAFWNFVGKLDDYDSFDTEVNSELCKAVELRKDEFITYFNGDVASITCCAMINERNSLDRFLLICLEHAYPIPFLEEAIASSKKLRTIF